jgi:hypothetical protein
MITSTSSAFSLKQPLTLNFGIFIAPSLCIMHQIETPHIPHIKQPHCDGQGVEVSQIPTAPPSIPNRIEVNEKMPVPQIVGT